MSVTVLRNPARYALLTSAPAPTAREVLDPVRTVAFLTVYWGDTVLFAGEVDEKTGFDLGEGEAQNNRARFSLPAQVLGADRAEFIRCSEGEVRLTLPVRAQGHFIDAQGARSLLSMLPDTATAREHVLPIGSRADLTLGDFRFQVEHTSAGRKTERQRILPEPEVLGFHALSFAVMGSLLGAMAYFLPSLGLLADEGTGSEDVYLIQQYLEASAEREPPRTEHSGDEPAGSSGSGAEAAQGVPSAASAPEGLRRLGNTVVPASRQETVQTAREFGMVALLETLGTEATSAAVWNTEIKALGGASTGLWGDELGDISGSGLRLHGEGQGSGGPGTGIDMGDIAGLPGRLGTPDGHIGAWPGRSGGPGYKPRAPKIGVQGDTVVSGHLPPELVQRTVRQNFGRFRLCYEQGLMKNPNLSGRVEVRFLIDSTGAVAQAMKGASDLPDASVVSCIVQQFFALSFPAPENGTVRVTYPLMLAPSS